MTGTLWMIFVLLPVCNYAAYLRCIPPNEQKVVRAVSEMRDERNVDSQMRFNEVPTEKPKTSRRRQKTFIRNPNYISANNIFDEEAKSMYITWLPLPHPGALAGSTNGCLQFEVIKD